MALTILQKHASVDLGEEMGRGGEGAVYAIKGVVDSVVKIYSTPPDAKKVEKLRLMVTLASPEVLKIAAWPLDLVDENRQVKGFTMPRVAGRHAIHELYGPKSRAETFPEADFRFVTRVSTNIARALAVLHSQGVVVGDINQGNLLVASDGTVKFIDCDSFQVSIMGKVFTCDVGVPLFTAPELSDKPFRGLVRNENHDAFGLAVVIFHLLFLGRHPFAGRYLGLGEMPIERALAEYRFPYGADASTQRMEPPPSTVQLITMGSSIRNLFERAFSRSGAKSGRPSAKSWVEALTTLESSLRPCTRAAWHHYPKQLSSCPWCVIEAQTGVRLFGQRVQTVPQTGVVDVSALWKAIEAVPQPERDPIIPSQKPWKAPMNVDLGNYRLKMARQVLSVIAAVTGLLVAASIGFVGLGIGLGVAALMWPRVPSTKIAQADRKLASAKVNWESAFTRWKREASREAFFTRVEALKRLRAELEDLPNERERRKAKLLAEREQSQRQRYLDRFRIRGSNIPGIGEGRSATLASYGIETAADVEFRTIMGIPGFGAVLTGDLVTWRRVHERNFRFNPHDPGDKHDLEVMEQDLASRKRQILDELQQGPSTLRQLSYGLVPSQARLMPLLEASWIEFKIAEAQRKSL